MHMESEIQGDPEVSISIRIKRSSLLELAQRLESMSISAPSAYEGVQWLVRGLFRAAAGARGSTCEYITDPSEAEP